jgi:aminoglycoside 3-N-acetyltransferase
VAERLPITRDDLVRDLRALGVRAEDRLMLHASLRALAGDGAIVVGGPVAVVEALQIVLTPRGTLIMPAFSADYSDPASWSNPPVPAAWWAKIREGMPAWRPDRAATWGIGAVAESFRRQRGVRRSLHPHFSFCAWGRGARKIVGDVALDDPLGPRGVLGRLRARRARVLLLGCGFRSCTAFHLAEHETRHPPPRRTAAAPLLDDAGDRRWLRWSEPAYDARRFGRIGEAYAGAEGCRRGTVGRAEAFLFDLADGVAFARGWLDRPGLG